MILIYLQEFKFNWMFKEICASMVNNKIDKYQRFHEFNFRKGVLSKKYGLPLEWTETEMVKHLGYDRICGCGLFKYELLVR